MPLQRVALDFHTVSSFLLVVQEDCGNDLEEEEASGVRQIDSIFCVRLGENQEIGAKH